MKPSQLIVEEKKMARDHVLRPGGITQNLKPENSNFWGVGGMEKEPSFLIDRYF